MFICLKKAKGGIFLGLGMGILAVLFLPLKVWLCIIGFILIICGLKLIFSKKSRR